MHIDLLFRALSGHLLLDNLDGSLRGVRADGLEFVLSGDHLRIRVAHRTGEVDRVELALDGAHTAAEALVRVDDGAAARQAAGRFGLDLVFGEDEVFIVHREDLLLVDALHQNGRRIGSFGRDAFGVVHDDGVGITKAHHELFAFLLSLITNAGHDQLFGEAHQYFG